MFTRLQSLKNRHCVDGFVNRAMSGSEKMCRRKDRWRLRCLLGVLFVGLQGRCVSSDDAPPSASLRDRVPVQASDSEGSDDNTTGGTAPRVVAAATGGTEHSLMPAIRLAQSSLTKLQAIDDYETTLLKRERVNGRLVEHTMHMKLREKPFSVYLKYGEPHVGREILYIDGQNAGKMWAREGSGLRALVGPVLLDPRGAEAMDDNRYPITMIGMRKLLETVIEQWKLESVYGEIDVKFYPNAKLRGRACKVVEASHPRRRRQFKFQKTRLYVDDETRLPIRVEQYGFPDIEGGDSPLDELYDYANLRTNAGLTDRDFDRKNPKYSF